MASVNTQDGQDSGGTVTSGDTSGGRGDGFDGREDVSFSEYVNGTWEIEYIDMVLNPDDEEIDLFCNIDGLPQLVLTGNSNNELSISALDGKTTTVLTSDFYGYEPNYGSITARGLAVFAGGKYTMTGDNTYKQVLSTRNQFTSNNYTLEGLRGIASKSSKWEYLKFTNTYVYTYDPINSFRLITTLVRAEYTPLEVVTTLENLSDD